MRALIVTVSAFVSVIVACSGGSGSIGSECASQTECTGVSSQNSPGFCNGLNVCTRDCTTHADCGCAPDTTNGDIANGKCGFACVNVGSAAVCAKVCANNTQCKGSTTCQPALDSSNNSLGYSECI